MGMSTEGRKTDKHCIAGTVLETNMLASVLLFPSADFNGPINRSSSHEIGCMEGVSTTI